MEKAIAKKVKLVLSKGSDGHWLHFEDRKGNSALINIENRFPNTDTIVDRTIRSWAKEQFEEKK